MVTVVERMHESERAACRRIVRIRRVFNRDPWGPGERGRGEGEKGCEGEARASNRAFGWHIILRYQWLRRVERAHCISIRQ